MYIILGSYRIQIPEEKSNGSSSRILVHTAASSLTPYSCIAINELGGRPTRLRQLVYNKLAVIVIKIVIVDTYTDKFIKMRSTE